MAGVKVDIDLSILAALEGTSDLGTPSFRTVVRESLKFDPGTAATDEANVLFADTRTLTASSTEDLDLTGTLTNPLGATVTQAEIVAIFVKARASNTNSVILGNATANGFLGPLGGATHTLTLKPGEFVLLSSQTGWAVTAGTGDLLKVANSAGSTSVVYDIVVIGRTVAA